MDAAWLARLGNWCAHHAWHVVVAWGIVVAFAAVGAARLPGLLSGGSGDIPGSASLRTATLLRTEFTNPYAQLLILAWRSGSLERTPDDKAALLGALTQRLERHPAVAGLMGGKQLVDQRLRPAEGAGEVLYIGLNAGSVGETERAVPSLRAAIAPILRAAQARHPDLEWAVTGRAALTYDVNQFNAADTTTAEMRVLPLTLIVLVLAFGSLVAAGVPITLGLISTTVSLGLVYLLARISPYSNLVQNVASMIGLAVGIDYSLLIIHRYREELPRGSGSETSSEFRRLALVTAMGTAGAAVFFSGLTVMVGMGGLLLTPLMETRAVGLGGCLVVAIAVGAALTLLPALLTLLGGALEWPALLSGRLHPAALRRRWRAWAERISRFPWLGAGVSLVVLGLLAWPGQHTRFGFAEDALVPRELEFRRGLDLLGGMGLAGHLAPVQVVLSVMEPEAFFARERLPGLLAFAARLRQDPRVASTFGPLDLLEDMRAAPSAARPAEVAAALAAAPQMREAYLSRDRRRMLLQVVLRPECALEEAKALAREMPGWMRVPGLRIDLGGQAVYYNDFDAAMQRAYGRSVGFVIGATFLILLLVFRAPLVATKAIILNLLSVLAGYGVVVWVFQLGHGASWFGLTAPVGLVPLTIPLLIFCILFGLSMDYEVFLLSRAREGWRRTGDSAAAVRDALVDTGPVITSAALIMVAVFGAFAFARMVMVQMLGLGLAVAVLVDATLIRAVLAPALMHVAGRWNWWPATPGLANSAGRADVAPAAAQPPGIVAPPVSASACPETGLSSNR